MTERKGARRIKDVPLQIKAGLDAGILQTANLTEWLSVDMTALVSAVFPPMGLEEFVPELQQGLKDRSKEGILKKTVWIGQKIAQILQTHPRRKMLFQKMAAHPSDMIRCFAAFSISPHASFQEQLEFIYPFAADAHFGVRECAFMALRPFLATQLKQGMAWLHPWALSEDPRIRRCAIEVSRPRGVWCAHIGELKSHPEIGLPLLELVRADAEKYVQDSVSNWLHDASKSQPDWVISVCHRWTQESPCPETQRIVKRALRTLHAKK